MARAREFDEALALEKAMLLFWERGYESASLSDLLKATDLSRSSFYEAFGTKRKLLLATLARYVNSGMCGLAEPLFRDQASRTVCVNTGSVVALSTIAWPNSRRMMRKFWQRYAWRVKAWSGAWFRSFAVGKRTAASPVGNRLWSWPGSSAAAFRD